MMTKKKITGKYSLEREILKLLMSKGYPEESFEFDWQQGDYKYSLAIFDPENKKLLAVFEYMLSKPNPVIISSESIRILVNKYASLIADPKVHFYIINAIEEQDSFSISKILPQTKTAINPVFLNIEKLLDFHVLKKIVLSREINEENFLNDPKVFKLNERIAEVDDLKTKSAWGPEHKIWDSLTKKSVKEIFGTEGLRLFEQEQTVVLTDEAYMSELDSRKILLEQLLINKNEYSLRASKEAPKEIGLPSPQSSNKKIDWTKWGTIATIIATLIAIIIWQFPKETGSNNNSSHDSIVTTEQNGGINMINTTTIVNRTASEEVKANQAGDNVTINLGQLKHSMINISYVIKNGQILSTPGDWIQKDSTVTLFNADQNEQFIIQYTY